MPPSFLTRSCLFLSLLAIACSSNDSGEASPSGSSSGGTDGQPSSSGGSGGPLETGGSGGVSSEGSGGGTTTQSGGAPTSGSGGGTEPGAGGSDAAGGGGNLGGARNLPAEDRVAFYLGQDSDTLGEFHDTVLSAPQSDFPAPDGVTLYTAILPTALHPNTAPAGATLYLSGIEGPPADDGNGNVDFSATLSQYDELEATPAGLAVGLYLSDEYAGCENQPLRALIDRGDDDIGNASDPNSLTFQWRAAMDRLIVWLQATERPVFLRIGYEFDGPWNCYNQDFYKQAFRYIKERIDALDAHRVATVWQAATYPDDGDPAYNYQITGGLAGDAQTQAIAEHYQGWYPGDDVVDWIGISFFAGVNYLEHQWSCPDADQPWTIADTSPRALQDALAQFSRDHQKPLLIAESAPQGFDQTELSYSCVAARNDHLAGNQFASATESYSAFFDDYFSFISENRDVLRLFSYINTNWQSQSRWACPAAAESCAQGYWGDTRLQAQPEILDQFASDVRELND